MVKVAVIGCGYWGRNIVRTVHELGALAAVADVAPKAAEAEAAKYGVTAMPIDAIIAARDIAGVLIATPAETHKSLALQALASGKHVFVEKPLALSVAEGLEMKAAAEAAGRTLMVGHLLQYHPAFVALRELVRRGELGALRYAYSNRLSLGKFRLEENAMWSFAPHDVSMILSLFGEQPHSCSWSGGAYVTAGVEDECRLDMAFSGGRRAHVFASWLHPFKEHRLVVVGETAMAVFEDSAAGADKLRLYKYAIERSGRSLEPSKSPPVAIHYSDEQPLKMECAHFLDCVAGRSRPLTDANEGLAVLRVLTGAFDA